MASVCRGCGGKLLESDENGLCSFCSCSSVKVKGSLAGIARNSDIRLKESLRRNFQAECTEVGMYLAMSRQAFREGFSEIGETFKRIALEEAEHAACFAEMLGEEVAETTEDNLQHQLATEMRECRGKKALAELAGELGYREIYDSVSEMCRDEIRHRMAYQGLLGRYFD